MNQVLRIEIREHKDENEQIRHWYSGIVWSTMAKWWWL